MQNKSNLNMQIVEKVDTDVEAYNQTNNIKKKKAEMSDTSIVTKDRSITVIQYLSPSSKEILNSRGSIRSPPRKHSVVQRTSVSVKNKSPKKKQVNPNDKWIIDVVNIESYKKYNLENCFNEIEEKDKTRCHCLIF